MINLNENAVGKINQNFENTLQLVEYKRDEILSKLEKCTDDEKTCLKFLYSTMGISDITDCEFDLFLSYVTHSLFLRANIDWCKNLPTDIFLTYVLYPRIHNENLEDVRKLFYEEVINRIKNMTVEEAVLEVNYWCLENVTYRATDNRTSSPFTVFKRAYGRCGEESTFTVCVLRSVGIPARQVYVPRWSHCDDNHAWVEVYVNGEWKFIGACEPEPILNKGWFNGAASRAMLVQSKSYGNYGDKEDTIGHKGSITIINSLDTYTKTKILKIKVVDSNGNPKENIKVMFEVLNFSEFFPIYERDTDSNGIVTLTTGLGSMHIHITDGKRFMHKLVNTNIENYVEFNFDNSILNELEMTEFDFVPPKDNINNSSNINQQKQNIHLQKFNESNNKRLAKEKTFYGKQNGIIYIDFPKYKNEINNILSISKYNYKVIYNFLSNDEYFDYKVKLLLTLREKDYTDVSISALEEHLMYSMRYKNDPDFEKYILCPRISFEPITKYRKGILEFFNNEQKAEFTSNPQKIWEFIQNNIIYHYDRDVDTIITSPLGVLNSNIGNDKSKKILFVAIARTLGIPSRINEIDGNIQYKDGGIFVNVEKVIKEKLFDLTINKDKDTKWIYYQNWTIAKLDSGVYHTLDYSNESIDTNVLKLPKANYKIITSNRMPNGTVYGKEYYFRIPETNTISIELRKSNLKDMLSNIELQDFTVYDNNSKPVLASSITKNNKNIIAFIEENKEPTEHLLNELMEMKEYYNKTDYNIIFILRDKSALENETLSNTLSLIPNIKVYYDKSNNASVLARRMYVDPEKLPLTVITAHDLTAIYAFSGYNVGVADLIMKILEI